MIIHSEWKLGMCTTFDVESIYIIRVAEQWESLCSQEKILNLLTLLPRIQAHPLIGAPAPNPNKGAC